LETANLVLSLFLPLLVTLVKQSGWDDRVNKLIALAVYLAWALIVTVAAGDFSVPGFLQTFAITLTTGTIAYQMIWKAFGIDDALTAVTSIKKAPEEDVVVEG